MFKVLLPTDFSENSIQAIDHVLGHFHREGVEFLLIHTIKAPHSATGVLIRIDDLMRKDAEVQMKDLVDTIEQKHGIRLQHEIKIGNLGELLRQYGRASHISLIAMGTKGETNLSSRLMGSVTESVIRTSRIPVLAIPNHLLSKDLTHMAIATSEDDIPQKPYLKDYLLHVKLKNLHIRKLKVVERDGLRQPKSIALNGYQVGVDTVVNSNVVVGINAYIDTHPTDLLVLFHKHNSQMDYFFNRSITKTICSKTSLPLLVIPNRM